MGLFDNKELIGRVKSLEKVIDRLIENQNFFSISYSLSLNLKT